MFSLGHRKGISIMQLAKLAFVLTIAMCLPSHVRAESDLDAQRIFDVQRKPDKAVIKVRMRPHEHILIAYSAGSSASAYAMRGIEFPEETKDMQLVLEVNSPNVNKRQKWKLLFGVEDSKGGSMVGGPVEPQPELRPEKGELITVQHLRLPLKMKEVEMHVFPLGSDGEGLGSVIIVIARDRGDLREVVQVQESFDWQRDFTAASWYLLGGASGDVESGG